MNRKMKSCVKGLLMGCCGKPMPLVCKKEPVAWLFNGVRLPDISGVWDGKYYADPIPYGAIFLCDDSIFPYRFVASNAPFVHVDSGFSASATLYVDYVVLNNEKWFKTAATTELGDIGILDCVWSSYDILNTDGSIYLATSDPIPVYE